ncbi:hypothetical protein D3C72_1657060 [compost metagenome]
MDDDATAAQLVERGEGLGRNRRINGVGPERDDDLDVLRMREHRGAQREGIERRGGIGNERVVEPIVVQCTRITFQEERIDRSIRDGVQIIGLVGKADADEFRSHGSSLVFLSVG